jgi:uncharacterized membrane-anchored protein YjiN (DUF445 family)
MGLAQIVIINRSLVEGLDNSLMEDARITLHLINSLPENADPEKILQHGSMRSSGSLRDLIDHTLSEVPDSVGGEKLTDRVMAQLIDDMLAELSFQDSTQSDFDPMDAVVQRNLSSKRNNYVENIVACITIQKIRYEAQCFFAPAISAETLWHGSSEHSDHRSAIPR